jgi:hypothetical protein
MNIQNRLKKIEDQMEKIDRVHCHCPREFVVHVILPSEDNDQGECSVCNGICLLDKETPCPKCGKPILIDSIKIELEG